MRYYEEDKLMLKNDNSRAAVAGLLSVGIIVGVIGLTTEFNVTSVDAHIKSEELVYGPEDVVLAESTQEELLRVAHSQIEIKEAEELEIEKLKAEIAERERKSKIERRTFSVYSEDGLTSDQTVLAGYKTRESLMCVATRAYPLGTKLKLTFPTKPEWDGIYTVMDRTHKKYGERIDVFKGSGKSREYLYDIGIGPVDVEVIE